MGGRSRQADDRVELNIDGKSFERSAEFRKLSEEEDGIRTITEERKQSDTASRLHNNEMDHSLPSLHKERIVFIVLYPSNQGRCNRKDT